MGQRRSFSCRSAALVTALVAAFVTEPAGATTIAARELPELAAQADAVVVARVERVGVRVELRDRRALPFTWTILEVERVLAGDAPSRVVVRELGGDAPTGSLHVEGTPRYVEGERVVAFLARHGGAFRTVGLAMGRWTLREVSGEAIAEQDLRALALLDARKGTVASGQSRRITLRELERLVRRPR